MNTETGSSCPITSCPDTHGSMPSCAGLAVPYVPFQQNGSKKYSQSEALSNGTLFPGLNLPFHLKTEGSALPSNPLVELQALEFVVLELGTYLDTHPDDMEAFDLFKQYAAMEKAAKETYEAKFGPLMKSSAASGASYRWLQDPWPWNYQQNEVKGEMFIYEKKLQFPVKISTPNPRLAAVIISQYGGPDGELGASMRYLSQRYAMPYAEGKGLLTDIGTEELGHMEMVAALVHQLTRNLTDEEVQNCPIFAPYFVDHTTGVYPTAASGFPWTAGSIQSTGDVIADLTEDLAAEQKARLTYDNILRLSDDPDVNNVIRFLREREIVHFQRFGECLRMCKEKMNAKNIYLTNPAFDKIQPRDQGRG